MYKYYNNNPANNDIADCFIRATSLAENISWRECQEKLSTLAREQGQMLDNVDFVEEYLDKRYPRECHYSKTVGEFMEEHPSGRFLITMPNHITCVIDGTCYDTFDPTSRIMRCAWRVSKNKRRTSYY